MADTTVLHATLDAEVVSMEIYMSFKKRLHISSIATWNSILFEPNADYG